MPVIISVTGCSTWMPRVHLDEIEFAVLVEKFDGADAEIANLAHGVRHDLADLDALRRR